MIVSNGCINPSFEAGTTAATAVPGATGAAALTNPTVSTPFGTRLLHCQWSTASTAAGGGAYVEVDVATAGYVAGNTISAGIFRLRSSIATRLQFSVEFRTGAATISTTTAAQQQVGAGTQYGAATSLADTETWLKLEGLVIPATCTKIRLAVLSVAGTGFANWSIGASLRMDAFMITKAATLPRYVDGSLGSGYYWSGAANASPSSLYVPSVVVVGYSTMDPQPRATIEIHDTYPDAATLTIVQLSDEGQINVRDAENVVAPGGVFKTDYEIPLGISTSYRAQMFTAGGADLGFTSSTSVEVDIDPGWAVVQDYLEPKQVVLVQAEKQFANTLQKTRTLALYPAGTDTVALLGELGLLTGLNLRLVTMTNDDQQALDTILENGTVLIRTMPPMPVPRQLFVAIGAPTRVPSDVRWGGETSIYDITGDEVSRNTLTVLVPVTTWADVIAFFASWTALIAAHSTWLDLIKNPPPEA